jgi:hypothetical protein
MGTVYAAIQPIIEKKVAIEVLGTQFSSTPDRVGRFVDTRERPEEQLRPEGGPREDLEHEASVRGGPQDPGRRRSRDRVVLDQREDGSVPR